MGTSALPSDLARGRSRFEAWRAGQAGRGRIPESLWRLAVRLASRHGVSRTAGALRVDYYRLKKRSETSVQEAPSNAPAFIEVPSPALVGKQCLFDLDNSIGARMRVQLLGYAANEIETLARVLWNAE